MTYPFVTIDLSNKIIIIHSPAGLVYMDRDEAYFSEVCKVVEFKKLKI